MVSLPTLAYRSFILSRRHVSHLIFSRAPQISQKYQSIKAPIFPIFSPSVKCYSDQPLKDALIRDTTPKKKHQRKRRTIIEDEHLHSNNPVKNDHFLIHKNLFTLLSGLQI